MRPALLAACVLFGALQGHAEDQAEAPGAQTPEDACEFLRSWPYPARHLAPHSLGMHQSCLTKRVPCLPATVARQASETCALLFQGTASASYCVTESLLGTVDHPTPVTAVSPCGHPTPLARCFAPATSQQSVPKAAT